MFFVVVVPRIGSFLTLSIKLSVASPLLSKIISTRILQSNIHVRVLTDGVCVCVCVRACVRACVCVCVFTALSQ